MHIINHTKAWTIHKHDIQKRTILANYPVECAEKQVSLQNTFQINLYLI